MGSFTFSVVTFGCRVNQADSFACERDLLALGGTAVAAEKAELVVVNTCSVTGAADQAARQAIRRLARVNPGARIAATGCYATRKPEDLEGLSAVVRLVPNQEKDALARLLVAGAPGAEDPHAAAGRRPGQRGRTVFPLRVQTGCDECCSYCTIPSTRGPSRSVPLAAVLAEVDSLRAAGYEEAVLTGVHLGAYGRDLDPQLSLADLLSVLDCLEGEAPTYRLSSVEPMDCTPAVIRTVAGSRRFAPHFHLPLQHASDRLLAAMRRPYSFREYRVLVETIRAKLPDAAIGADVIVGFPGEAAEDQALLERYLPGSGLSHLHVFPYSDRPGTIASTLPGKVSARRIKERAEALRAVSGDLHAAFVRRQVGQVRPGLTIEGGSEVLTDNYLKVRIPPGHARNQRVRVRILSAIPLQGEVVA